MKTIIILGGSSSIGKSICNEFNTQGNRVISTFFSKKDLSNYPKNTESIYLNLNDNESIINLSQKLTIYSASMAAILSFIKSFLPSLPKGSTINAIAPGLIQDNSMFKDMTKDRQESHKKQIFSGSLLDKDDLAKIIFDLCQDHWMHLNGACIDLNGGQYLR